MIVGLTIPVADGCASPGGGALVGGVEVPLISFISWTGLDWLIFPVRNRSGISTEGNPSFWIPTAMWAYPGRSINFSLWPEVIYEFNAEM